MDAPLATVSTAVAPQPLLRPAEPARVTPPPSTAATRDRPSQADARLAPQRSIERDTETGSLVYRLTDMASGVVTVQTPSVARLQLRAYIDGVLTPKVEPAVEVTA